MIETINGLHKCQPKNTPTEGDVKTFAVIRMPAKNGKKAWIKIKGESAEKGGMPYRILTVTPTGWEPDDYGNLAFNVELEEAIEPATLSGSTEAKLNAEGDRLKASEVQRPAQNYSQLDERQRAIIRQHSQSMAIEVLKLKVTLNELTPEDITPTKLTSLANYFDADVIGAAQHNENA